MKLGLLRLGEKHRYRTTENKVTKRIIGPEKQEVTGDLRKLHVEELGNLKSPNIIAMIR
jgi:hypothetical protein